MGKLTFVQGGFAPVGGIETFAVDILSAVKAREVETELVCWDAAAGGGNPGLEKLSQSGVAVHCSSWRWGCRWGWPDKAMAHRHWKTLLGAEVLVFGKLLHESVHRNLLPHRKRMVLVTPYRPAEMWKDRKPDKEILNSFESIVVQAQSFEDDLRRFGYEGRAVALPYLPPEAKEASAWPATQVLQVGFLGRFVPDKNLEYLIVSFSHLRELGVEANLHMFGDGPERDALRSLVDRMGLIGSVRFHGNQQRSDIASALDRCHLLAFSSRTEGQPLASLEALARGRPVLGTPVGSFPEYLSGALGSVAPLDNPIAYATALKALGQPLLSREMTPGDVQRAYETRFPRWKVIDEYLLTFGCCGSTPKRKQAV
jgi:glycosyltransferase involved in cell wall biosynthesis